MDGAEVTSTARGSFQGPTYAKWDNEGRFICPFTPDNILKMHAVYMELKTSTSPTGQEQFKKLHFQINGDSPIHHSSVVFEKPEDLVRFISAQIYEGFGTVTGNKYTLTGRPIICIVDPIIDYKDQLDAALQSADKKLMPLFTTVSVPTRKDPSRAIVVRPTILYEFGSKNGQLKSSSKMMMATQNAAVENIAGDWFLNLPITSRSAVVPVHHSGSIGSPDLLPKHCAQERSGVLNSQGQLVL
jgi:hypothetical protein